MRKGFKIPKDDLCYEEDIDEVSFTDYVPPSKNCVSLFSFTDEDKELIQPQANILVQPNSNENNKMLVQSSTSSNESNQMIVHTKPTQKLNSTDIKLVHHIPKVRELVHPITPTNTTPNQTNNQKTLIPNINIFDNRTLPIANGSAPSINGEKPTLKRTYKLRNTTIRKLNELIAIHSEPNTYVSTIVDIAIEFYYDFIKNEKL